MCHPLEKIPYRRRPPLLLMLLSLTGAVMAVLSRTLRGERYGIVDLELAGDEEEAQRILDTWEASGARDRALLNVHLDVLFLTLYSTTVALACVMAASMLRTRARGWAWVGVALAWAQWLAAVLDAVENVALLKMLGGAVAEPWPQVARWSAWPKFILVGAGAIYAVAAACVRLAGRDWRR